MSQNKALSGQNFFLAAVICFNQLDKSCTETKHYLPVCSARPYHTDLLYLVKIQIDKQNKANDMLYILCLKVQVQSDTLYTGILLVHCKVLKKNLCTDLSLTS